MNDNTASQNMNDNDVNGGATMGASSDGDLDFQGEANHTADANAESTDTSKDCDCAKSCGCEKTDKTGNEDGLANHFPKSQEPSGDGTGIKAGGKQAL